MEKDFELSSQRRGHLSFQSRVLCGHILDMAQHIDDGISIFESKFASLIVQWKTKKV